MDRSLGQLGGSSSRRVATDERSITGAALASFCKPPRLSEAVTQLAIKTRQSSPGTTPMASELPNQDSIKRSVGSLGSGQRKTAQSMTFERPNESFYN